MNGKWFCAGEKYAINRIMLLSGMQLSGIDCTYNIDYMSVASQNVP